MCMGGGAPEIVRSGIQAPVLYVQLTSAPNPPLQKLKFHGDSIKTGNFIQDKVPCSFIQLTSCDKHELYKFRELAVNEGNRKNEIGMDKGDDYENEGNE